MCLQIGHVDSGSLRGGRGGAVAERKPKPHTRRSSGDFDGNG